MSWSIGAVGRIERAPDSEALAGHTPIRALATALGSGHASAVSSQISVVGWAVGPGLAPGGPLLASHSHRGRCRRLAMSLLPGASYAGRACE